MRWWLLGWTVVTVGALYALDVQAQSRSGYEIASGPLEAENGGIECWFNIGHDENAFGLAPHPKGIACVRLKEFAGRSGTLFFIPDP